ncbi:MAG: von Willebrand factor type A domain-containing protein [Kiritimatiellales bacterium]
MNCNDPKLTAYALGELSESDRQAVEHELEANPEARRTVEEICELGRSIESHYAAEAGPELSHAQRDEIFSRAGQKRAERKIVPFPRHRWMPYAASAAMLAFVLFLSGSFVMFSVVQKEEKMFSPPSPIVLPRMQLKKTMIKSGSMVRQRTMEPRANPAGTYGQMMDSFVGAAAFGPSLEDYEEISKNGFHRVGEDPLSTFSIDVDTASYANVRRFLKDGIFPPKDAVRIEEMINYFSYDYAPPTDGVPFHADFAQSICPWNPQHRLVRIGLKGRIIEQSSRPPLNLVFLLDVSGSMNSPNKLPLVKRALAMLTQQLDERDRVAIVVYAGASGLVLPPTAGADRQAILGAIARLDSGGGTNGGQGIELAYRTAQEHVAKGGVNRVMLCTDGDFNIGVTQRGDLNRLIEEKAKSGIFLSVLGFGMGNYKDSTLEQLADRGNGNYAYIDTFSEARKVLVDQMSGTLVTIAKDVKIQVEFNPAKVAGYRLIGYENRMLAAEDFNDDTKDAGEIGAGHTVTALYELVPAGQPVGDRPAVDDLKYQHQTVPATAEFSEDLITVKLRYKLPDGDTSRKLSFPLHDESTRFEQTDSDFRFAAAVAGFGMLLRDSEYKGEATYDQVIEWAQQSVGVDPFGYRRECIDLMRNAKALSSGQATPVSE